MRFPNQRLAQLFDTLQSETLPQDELARRFSVSTRTVRTDINMLNEMLAEHGALFVLSRGEGYQLRIHDPARYQRLRQQTPSRLRVPRTSNERIHYLLTRFLTSAGPLSWKIWRRSGLSAAPRCKAIWPRCGSGLAAIS